MRQRIEGGLSIMAQLKAEQIAQWRAERLKDANTLMGSPFFIEGVEEYMASPADTENKDKILARVAVIAKSHQYQDILLVDVNGSVLLSLNDTVYRLGEITSAQLAVAIKENKAVMTDFYYDLDSDSPRLEVIAPLFPWGADSQPAIGAVVFCIEPSRYLYPLLQSSPMPSETAETLLVERDGDQLLFLNELRHQKDTALKLRIPLSRQEVPAVMAVLGKEGVVEGRDYRGVEVLAALKHIPDSPWYMVTKIDTSEALSAWFFQAGIIVASVAGLLVAALAATGFIWQRRQRLTYQALYQAEVEVQALRSHFEYLVKYANDIIVLADEDQHIVEANDRALETYGYTREEMLDLPMAALIPPGGFSSYQARLRKMQKEGTIVAEAIHQRKDGSTLPVEVSARPLKIEGKQYIQTIIRDITERKQTEHEKATILTAMSEHVVYQDLEHRVLWANRAAAESVGLASEDMAGRYCYEIWHQRSLPCENCQVAKARETGMPQESEARSPDGRFWLVRGYPVIGPDGVVSGAIEVTQDITERKKAEAEYRSLIRASMDCFWLQDMQGNFLDVNDAYCQLMGYSRDEFLNMSVEDVEAIEKPEEIAEHLRKIEELGYDRFETRHRRKDGGIIDVEVSVNYLSAAGGRMFIFLRDITERKRAEEALADEATRRRILMDQSRDGISVLDENSKLCEANQRFAEMLGYIPEELQDFHTWDWDTQWAREELLEMGRSVDAAGVHLETRHRRKDGTVFDVDISVNSAVIAGQKLLFCVSRDITERKQAEESLRLSEQNFRDSIENSPLGIRIADEHGKTLYANRALLDIWGYSSIEELEAVPRKQRYTPESYDEHRTRIDKRKRGERFSSDYELSIVCSDGQVRILSVSRGELLWDGEKQFQLVYQDITERKQAEDIIRENEGKYRQLFELGSDALVLIEIKTGRILDLNNAAIEMYGYSREEALQMKNTDFSAEPDKTRKATLASKEHIPVRYHRRKDGAIFPVDMAVAYYTWYGKEVCVAAIRDITDRKRAEEALRESEERYRVLVELSPEAIFVASEGKHVFANSAAVKLLGASSPDQIIGRPVTDFVHPDYREIVVERMRKAMKTGMAVPALEEKYIRFDKTEIDVEVRAAPLVYRGKMAMQATVSDITERREAEESLRLSEQNFRDSIENSPLGIRIADEDGKTLYANRALLDIWGYSSIEELEAVPRKQRYTPESYDEHRTRIDKRKRGERFSSDYELSIVCSDGQVRILSVSRGELLWDGEKQFQLVYQDITELKLATEELEKAVEELQRSNAELERFAYVASHDLQEPLRMVSSYTQLLERRYKDKLDADANDFINYAVGGVSRMQELLNDLLVYSRVGTHAKPFKRTDMKAVLEATLANLQVTIEESKARVTHDALPTLMADEGQLVQVFQNLIGNAIKFRGEKLPRIHVSAEQMDSEWVFSVKDNGIGIEPQYFDRIFFIFQRLHREEYPGTGAGLAIAKKIVERHGGRMWIESQLGKGSTFYFSVKATGERNVARDSGLVARDSGRGEKGGTSDE